MTIAHGRPFYAVQMVPLCLGFSSVVAQIVLLRELVVVFCGNEMSLGLMLAVWLLWTAIGAGLLRARQTLVPPRILVANLQIGLALALPLAIVVVRFSRAAFNVVPGELLGPGAMVVTCIVVLAPFCVLSGWVFAAASTLYAAQWKSTAVSASGSVYLFEACGSAAGGLIASFALLRYCDPLQIAFIVAAVNAVFAVFLLIAAPGVRIAIAATLVILLVPAVLWLGSAIENSSMKRLWRGFDLLASRNTIYGRVDAIASESTRSIYENGLVVAHAEDPANAEEGVHLALLQHPKPSSLLMIGGGINGSLAQALQYPTLERIDYVELDPAIIELARTYFPEQSAPLRARSVHVHNIDGRLFLKSQPSRYDVIIVNLPDPQTAQLNRFYTREFFSEASDKLTAEGIFSFQLRGAEDYISPDLAEFLRCIHRTLRSVFAETVVIPGDNVHFTAAKRVGVLTANPERLMARLHEQRIHTSYVREYYLPFRMSPDRMQQLADDLAPKPGTPLNRDLAPSAYYFSTTLWSTQFASGYGKIFVRLARVSFEQVFLITSVPLLAIALATRWRDRRKSQQSATAGFCVAAMGFTLLSAEILLLLSFQALYGYVYRQLAIIVAGFMTGMAAGSWGVVRATDSPDTAPKHWTLAMLQGIAMILGLFLYFGLQTMSSVTTEWRLVLISNVVFPAIAIACGALGGCQFQVATRMYFGDGVSARPAAVYALDLLGACAGAIITGTYLVPVFGVLKTAGLIAVLNLAGLVAALPLAVSNPHPAR